MNLVICMCEDCPKCGSKRWRCIAAPQPIGIYNCLDCSNVYMYDIEKGEYVE
jgi:hypothetical protein